MSYILRIVDMNVNKAFEYFVSDKQDFILLFTQFELIIATTEWCFFCPVRGRDATDEKWARHNAVVGVAMNTACFNDVNGKTKKKAGDEEKHEHLPMKKSRLLFVPLQNSLTIKILPL